MFREAKFKSYTSNEIKPEGWLKSQLEIQADGLSGNLYKIWPDIRDSSYVGGKIDSWERVPYWLDGFIPLAYLLNDKEKIAVSKKYIDGIISSQDDDGWICICKKEDRAKYDIWTAFLILKVLVVYYDCSHDERIESVVYKSLKNLESHIHNCTIMGWASARWYECLISIYWLYGRVKEDWLLKLGISLYAGGINYKALLSGGLYEAPENSWNYESHVVNVAMAIKSEALLSQITKEADIKYSKKMLEFLDKFHGTAVGHFNGDECLSGKSPIQGAELCSVVEAMYSYETIFGISGDNYWLERLEKLAFNALPAAISDDMWTHQYDQQVNQVGCVNLGDKSIFRTNGPESHLFGLEPHFGCCTANFNQGWPKFALSTFYHNNDTIVSAALAPATLTANVGNANVCISLATEYPFEGTLNYTVTTDLPQRFKLLLRIPKFVKNIRIDTQFEMHDGFAVIDREWDGEEKICVKFDFNTEFKQRDGMYVLERGPLVYSLEIKEEFKRLEYIKDGVERKYPYCDYEIYPKSKWNYAFADFKTEVLINGMSDIPFSKTNPPIEILVDAVEIPWHYKNGYNYVCSERPDSLQPISEPVKVRFKPYGCSTLRLTQIPLVK